MMIEKDIMEYSDMYRFYMELRNDENKKKKEIEYIIVNQKEK